MSHNEEFLHYRLHEIAEELGMRRNPALENQPTTWEELGLIFRLHEETPEIIRKLTGR